VSALSVPHGLLALLHEGPRYGYQLRTDFEARTGGTWPLNVGQVYTTLSRLERDGLVEPGGEDAEGRTVYRITDAGSQAVQEWFTTPVAADARPRDELAIKLALAVTVPGVDVHAVVDAQRVEVLRFLRDLVRAKRHPAAGPCATAAALVLESLVLKAEAEARWLDHVEQVLSSSRTSANGSSRKVTR
jgi:DNA-binding PadR family transcriptional regulator